VYSRQLVQTPKNNGHGLNASPLEEPTDCWMTAGNYILIVSLSECLWILLHQHTYFLTVIRLSFNWNKELTVIILIICILLNNAA